MIEKADQMNNDPNEIAANPQPDRAPECTCEQVNGHLWSCPKCAPQPDRAPGHTPEELEAQIMETLEGLFAQALAAKNEEIARLTEELESHAFELSPAMVQARNDQLQADLAAERAKREANDLHCQQLADEVLSERDAANQRAEQTEARLADQKRVMLMEAAKCAELLDTFKTIRGGWVLKHEVAKLIDAAISSEPHAALQRYGLEVAERAWDECFRKHPLGFLYSETRASLTGQTEVQP